MASNGKRYSNLSAGTQYMVESFIPNQICALAISACAVGSGTKRTIYLMIEAIAMGDVANGMDCSLLVENSHLYLVGD
jgi:hypothetical protein